MYQLNLFKLLHSFDDHIYQVKEAERINNLWKFTVILTVCGMFIYGWIGYLGIGSQLILNSSYQFTPEIYESNKFWFIAGRVLFGFIFSLVVIFLPALIFKWLFAEVSFDKLVSMQLIVLFVLLIERLTWIPLVTIFGLDWFASPLSFGVIASYITSKSWVVYFFGSISIFEVFIMVFQIKFLTALFNNNKGAIYVTVISLHFIQWWLIALTTFISPYLIEGWF